MINTDYAVTEGVELITYLQMLEIEKKNFLLRVTAQDKNGAIYMRGGELVDAKTANHDVENAVLEMMAWADVTITAVPWQGHSKHKRITRSLESMIFEIVQQQDESQEYRKESEGSTESLAHVEEAIASMTDLRFYSIMNNKGEFLCKSKGDGNVGADFISYLHYNGTIWKNDTSLTCNFSYFQFFLEDDSQVIIFFDEHTVVGIETQVYLDCSKYLTQFELILQLIQKNRSTVQ